MTLNKYQLKESKLLDDRLAEIQQFINENIIKTKTPLKKKEIYNGLGSLVSDMDEAQFGRIFALCIKLKKIKGIEGAKRAGYKPIGVDVSKVAEEKPYPDFITNNLEQLQAFVTKHIVEANTSMTGSEILEQAEFLDVTYPEFGPVFSLAVRSGLITGIEGARGVGYRPAGSSVTGKMPPEALAARSDENKMSIRLSKFERLCAVDKRNWALQKLQKVDGNDTWFSSEYWISLDSALKGIAKRILNNQIRKSHIEVADLKELCHYIQEAEERVIKAIKGEIEDIPDEEEEDSSEAVA